MIKFFKHKGSDEILKCAQVDKDDNKKVVAVLGSYKALKKAQLVDRRGPGQYDGWLVIDAKTYKVLEAPDKATAKNWCVDQYDEDFCGEVAE